MYAMILAAGRGERMRPLTDNTPKPLLRAGGHYLIEYQLQALARANIRNVVINHAYLGAQIMDTLGDGAKHGLKILYSAEPEGALETGGGILQALPLLKTDPFLVVNGDVWTDYTFSNLPHEITGLAHIVLVQNPVHNPEGDFVLSGRRVFEPGRTCPGRIFTFSGIGLYRHALFQNSSTKRFPLASVLKRAIKQQAVTGEYYAGDWVDVGTRSRLAQLDQQLTGGKVD